MARQEGIRFKANDYYAYLNLEPNASNAEIKRHFRNLALKWHPDKHPEGAAKRKANDIFQKVNEAHEVLSNAATRQRYDIVWRSEHRGPFHQTPEWAKGASSRAASSEPVPQVPSNSGISNRRGCSTERRASEPQGGYNYESFSFERRAPAPARPYRPPGRVAPGGGSLRAQRMAEVNREKEQEEAERKANSGFEALNRELLRKEAEERERQRRMQEEQRKKDEAFWEEVDFMNFSAKCDKAAAAARDEPAYSSEGATSSRSTTESSTRRASTATASAPVERDEAWEKYIAKLKREKEEKNLVREAQQSEEDAAREARIEAIRKEQEERRLRNEARAKEQAEAEAQRKQIEQERQEQKEREQRERHEREQLEERRRRSEETPVWDSFRKATGQTIDVADQTISGAVHGVAKMADGVTTGLGSVFGAMLAPAAWLLKTPAKPQEPVRRYCPRCGRLIPMVVGANFCAGCAFVVGDPQ